MAISYSFSVFIPCYNSSKTVEDTINSILNQSYKNFEIIIRDNQSTDNTYQIISRYKSKKIKIFRNLTNLGYSGNLQAGIKDCTKDITIFMASDDILDINALKYYNQAFNLSKDIGAATRPYFWFNDDIKHPVRIKKPLNSKKYSLVKFNDNFYKVKEVLATIDQVSGLALKNKFIQAKFGIPIWISHAYPFVDIFTKHPVVFLKQFTVAVRIGQSATRSNIYQKSPMLFWIEMLNDTITHSSQQSIKQNIIREFVAVNFIGLIQIKNFGSFRSLFREIFYLIKFNHKNLFNPQFWLITLAVVILPRTILLPLTDWFKNHIYAKYIKNISFTCNLSRPKT